MIESSRAERVVHLTIDAPKVNVLDVAVLTELTRALRRWGQEDGIAAILLSGAGRCFSAGASVADHKPDRAPAMLEALTDACTALADLPMPVVALVHGACLGGAMELVSFCDFVVADPDATFAQSEIKLAFFPPLACSQLPRLVGLQNAAFLTLTGEAVGADRALAMALVQMVLPKADWGRLESLFNGLSVPALRVAKAALRKGAMAYDRPVLDHLGDFFLSELYRLEDVAEGIASFEARRPPTWKHR
jgi:cyclohexa-1,5-dienecarbonyl-CoA hydratase